VEQGLPFSGKEAQWERGAPLRRSTGNGDGGGLFVNDNLAASRDGFSEAEFAGAIVDDGRSCGLVKFSFEPVVLQVKRVVELPGFLDVHEYLLGRVNVADVQGKERRDHDDKKPEANR